MEDAGTVDLRGDAGAAVALKVLGKPSDPAVANAVAELRAWCAQGSHRRRPQPRRRLRGLGRDPDHGRLVAAAGQGRVRARAGSALFGQIQTMVPLDNPPNNGGDHLGSAYQDGWWGYASKDLRRVLGRREKGKFSRVYCGGGVVKKCRAALLQSLRQAIATPASSVYKDSVCAAQGKQGSQPCFDTIMFRPLGAVTQPLTEWVNRPTFQQVVEVQGHR